MRSKSSTPSRRPTIIDAYRPPREPFVAVPPLAGTGRGATEAPRGVVFHRYELDPDGMIGSARIVPPTSQDQAAIEDDMREVVQARLDLDDQALTSVRAVDPQL